MLHPNASKILLTVFWIVLALLTKAQTYKFKTYGEQDGLSSRYVYTLNQDNKGYLLIGTSEGVFRFDGFRFITFSTKDSLADNHITCSFLDKQGVLWYGHNNGDVSSYSNGRFEAHRLNSTNQSRIIDIAQSTDGSHWAVSQNQGVTKISTNKEQLIISEGLLEFNLSSLFIDEANTFWFGTDLGLIKCTLQPNNSFVSELIDGFPVSNVTDITPLNEHSFIVATEDAGIFKVESNKSGFNLEPIQCLEMDLSTAFVKEVKIDAEKNLWICTNNLGLVKLANPINGSYQKAIRFAEEGADNAVSIKTSFTDREGNLWMGSIGSGLLKLQDDFFSLYKLPESLNPMALMTQSDSLWIGTTGNLLVSKQHPGNITHRFGKETGIPVNGISCVASTKSGDIWIGTVEEGLWKKGASESRFKPFKISDDNLSKKINAIAIKNDMMVVATDYGAYILKNEAIANHLSIESGMNGNVVKSLLLDSQSRIWLGTTTSEILYVQNGELMHLESPLPNTALAVRCLVEDQHGDIWIGTEGAGIMNVTNPKNLFVQKSDGLYSDFCYSLVCDQQGQLWVGHHGAVSRLNLKKMEVQIFHPSANDQINFYDNAIAQSTDGLVYFGTDMGILRYDPSRDKLNGIEPILNFNKVLINDSLWNMNTEISLPYGDYKLEFFFTGISLRNPEKVTYQYFLEGNDLEWSPASHLDFARYQKLSAGTYTFKVKAFNSDGIGGQTIHEIKITIAQPFWMQPWFWILCGVILFLSIRFIIRRRERILRENQEMLQRELDARTKEVVQQKELIEAKNKDITDSILYAKNIQKAMLPAMNTLNSFFSESFVFYKPRDIVSGDFYWAAQFESKVLIACADCTGHGVPGAFMSLIGTTVLKEVARMRHVTSPQELLNTLDVEIYNLLSNKSKDFLIEDGMDIAVIEYDIQTREARISSANRPVFIVRNGELQELKGDRRAIGGSTRNENSSFNQHEVSLNAGDTIYLFSDGITDQFGGPQGKKLKKSGLIDLLMQSQHMPLEKQGDHVRKAFREWLGETAQIDDVILMGMRV
jgi:ligand-binding sensor domain-containing protein/serine phosphatase RsbU (regulator of sigma subunit)